MDYSLLNNTNYNSSIFRILDEVATAIKSIKKTLKEKGFKEEKLELAIGGASSGAHIALLYAYLYKKSPLPIKFAINLVGPITDNFTYYYQIKDPNKPLDNIEQKDIERAINQTTIVPIKGALNNSNPMELVNLFLGYKYNEIKMNLTDPKCGQAYFQFQFLFPIKYADKNVVPTLCLYTGKDMVVGVRQYSYLKSKFVDKKKIDIYYCKNLTHDIYVKDSQDSNKCFTELYAKISNFTNKYFSKNK
jgi:acetyl esterase/lipase